MDVALAINYFNKITKEAYTEETDKEKKEKDTEYNGTFTVKNMSSIFLFVAAIYLSWTCNSNCFPNMNVVEKVLRAFFAGLFCLIYLIIYLISWSSSCSVCVSK